MRKIYLGCLLLVMGALLVACGQEEKAPANINEYLAQATESQPQSTDVKKPPAYIYRPVSQQSPFTPGSPSLSPLQKYELSQLTMVGTVQQGDKVWGIVRAPDGGIYPVAVDSGIGSKAYVTQITSQQITAKTDDNQVKFLVLGQVTGN